MTKCILGKVEGLQACSYSCAIEHNCKVEVDNEFVTLLKTSLTENKDLMEMLSET